MKKLLLLVGIAAVLGAGCNQSQQETREATSVAVSPTTTQQQPKPEEETVVSADELKEAPAIAPSDKPLEDDRAWIKQTTRTGVTLTFPIKGPNAPTWEYAKIANDDAHLQGDCYVTNATVTKRTGFSEFVRACQTTTAFETGPGTRTDYFVFYADQQIGDGKPFTQTHLFTFTKKYPAGFDMNAYDRVLEKVIKMID